ncbi:MAG: sigma-70 family RNA polymerase sigma factor [Planctomycetota bacterium]
MDASSDAPPQPPTDPALQELSAAAASGDRAAIDALLARYSGELHAFVRLRAGKLVQRRESSADIVQSVCREVLEHAERFQYPSEASFKRWLYTTALRKIKNRNAYYLASKRDALREEPAGDGGFEALAEHYEKFASPSRHAIAREEIERVERTFARLTEEQREVVTLAHLVGLSREEIAVHLGKSEGAVRVTLHRALVRISELLDAEGE